MQSAQYIQHGEERKGQVDKKENEGIFFGEREEKEGIDLGTSAAL